MKQCGLVCVSLVLLLCFCMPVFAQPNTKSVQTIGVDDFDTPDAMEWSWNVQASRFIAEGFPKIGYVEGLPNSLRPFRTESDPTPIVLGVQTSFDRKGDNWFEVFPVSSDADGNQVNYEIPLKGQVGQIDFWVWGANYNYFLEILVRDADGRVHVLPATTLNFSGWRNLVVKIPTWLNQKSRLRSGPETMSFVGFRIRSDANEYVDDFAIYFDKLTYTTHTMSYIYDGYELRQTDFDAVGQGAGK